MGQPIIKGKEAKSQIIPRARASDRRGDCTIDTVVCELLLNAKTEQVVFSSILAPPPVRTVDSSTE